VEKSIKQGYMDIVYPQVAGLPDQAAQERINRLIEEQVYRLIARQKQWPESAGLTIAEMKGTYTIEANKNGVLSVRFENYTFPENAAHGLTMVNSITLDLATAKVYTLRDLFQPGTGYIMTLDKMIAQQFKERDIPMINEFKGITINQDYYLTGDALVIYFQAYEYTPGYVGIPEFEIPYRKIINIINEQGPIGKLTSDRCA
jgi:hypothetical protein